MYATDLEKNHPLCQVLLLDHSIENFCLYFLTIGPSRNRILKFTKFVQESGQTGILGGKLTRDDLTLKFFFENKTLSDLIFKHFSPLQVLMGKDNGKGSAQLPSSDGCAATNSGGGMFADKDDGIHKSFHTKTGAPSATVANLSASIDDRTKRSKKD